MYVSNATHPSSPVGHCCNISNQSVNCVLPVLLAAAFTIFHLLMQHQQLGPKSLPWQEVFRENRFTSRWDSGIVLLPKTQYLTCSHHCWLYMPPSKSPHVNHPLAGDSGLNSACLPGVWTVFPNYLAIPVPREEVGQLVLTCSWGSPSAGVTWLHTLNTELSLCRMGWA